ncbi:hypothetical protein QBZ16_004025 [Prototheca wickerhamii]|uniref:Protein kinase domain-containing protein n=1 Tax=Prototheca wickerhamii TaxID=3111 RepID=A0AAD9IL16_PROWI|nr:hypothetical protein QBZ16_004025 [Prototheca wickerhamii]
MKQLPTDDPQKRLVRAISLHLSPQKSRLQPLLSGAIELEDLADPGFADANEALLDDPIQSIGRWDIVVPIQRLGSGASGCVYKASWKGAPVAVKYIPCRAGDESALRAAVREVVLAKSFAHPHVVQCFDWAVLTSDGDPYEGARALDERAGSGGAGLDAYAPYGAAGPPPGTPIASQDLLKGLRHGGPHSSAPASPGIPAFHGVAEDDAAWRVRAADPAASPHECGQGGGERQELHSQAQSPISPTDSAESESGFGSPRKHKLSFRVAGLQAPARSVFELEDLGPEDAVLAVLMEHCDLGSLARALHRRVYLPSERWPAHTTQRALLRTAQEVAKGMAYIHENGVVHGDLKPANILLTTHRSDRRGYVAKIADFGLARGTVAALTRPGAAASTSAGPLQRAGAEGAVSGIGTAAYSAPELVAGGAATAASDAFAFGIILWEMVHCRPVYADLGPHAVLAGVLRGDLRPEFDPGCLPPLEALARDCWAQDPRARPSFQEALERLVVAEMELRSHHMRQASVGAGTLVATPPSLKARQHSGLALG